MKFRPGSIILSIIAGTTGFVVLLGYFLDLPLLADLRKDLLQWAVVLTAVAVVVGVANIFQVHWKKVTTRQSGGVYSFVLILSLLLTIFIVGIFGPTASFSLWIYNYIQVPIEASVLALLAIVLTSSAVRVLSRRPDAFSLIFVATALLILLGTITFPLGFSFPIFSEVRLWIVQSWVSGGARGILLGVALGTIATALRVLIGADRPYGG